MTRSIVLIEVCVHARAWSMRDLTSIRKLTISRYRRLESRDAEVRRNTADEVSMKPTLLDLNRS